MGFIQALSTHLHQSVWSYPCDSMPPGICGAAAESLHLVAADATGTDISSAWDGNDSLPAPFGALLTMLASDDEWTGGMAQSWLLQLLLVHAEVAMAGMPL